MAPEPELPAAQPTNAVPGESTETQTTATSSPHVLTVNELKQKRMEEALRGKVHVVKYPSNIAGSPITAADNSAHVQHGHASPFVAAAADSGDSVRVQYDQASSGYAAYENTLSGSADNPDRIYAPFASRTDWEIARWAKLRGPGSTAVSELLSIERVRLSSLPLCSTHVLMILVCFRCKRS